MSKYAYRGRDSQGGLVEGVIDGESSSVVARQLRTRGLTPIMIREASDEPVRTERRTTRRKRGKPSLEDLMFFCRQMYTLSRSGVPLIRGLTGMAESTRNERLSLALIDIIRQIESGYGLSQTFSQHADIFPQVMIGILQVGENSGRIDDAFLQISGYLERERDTRSRIAQAVRYPVMVLVSIAAAIVVINLFVIPAFARVFEGFGAELPWMTRLLLTSSQFSVRYWPVLLSIIGLSVWAWLRWVSTEQGRLWWDRWKLRMPVIGPILTKAILARFARSFSMMLKSGVPIVQSLNLLVGAIDNAFIGESLKELRRAIERGEGMGRTAATQGLFPPLVLQMIDVGEESGRLDDMLAEVAEFYDREVDTELKNLSTAIEPLLLLIVGVMVLILALGVFLPMWDLNKVALHKG